MVEKLIRNGKVAVIYSPGYGAGWSTWSGSNKERMVFDPVIAQMLLDKKDINEILEVARGRYRSDSLAGLEQCRIEWIQLGTSFHIEVYDGSESIRIIDDLVFHA